MLSNSLSWSDYVMKYKEASDFVNKAQDAISDLNVDLASFSCDAIMQGAAELDALPELLNTYPDLNRQAVSQFMSGLDGVLSQVLSNYVPMLNGRVAVAANMNIDAATQISIDSPGGVFAVPDWVMNIMVATNFTISGLANAGLITVDLNPFGTAGDAALSDYLNSY